MTSLDCTAILLNASLQVAVPMQVARYKNNPVEYELDLLHSEEIAQEIACHGDGIMFREQQTSKYFCTLVKAIALGSLKPGGIEFMGIKYESELIDEDASNINARLDNRLSNQYRNNKSDQTRSEL